VRGCVKDSPIPGAWKIGNDEFSRCPRALVTEKSFEYLNAYFFFEKGYLPNPGGWMDQPVKFIEAIVVMAYEFIRIGKKDADKQRA
jgi:hypothetical protein